MLYVAKLTSLLPIFHYSGNTGIYLIIRSNYDKENKSEQHGEGNNKVQ